MTGLFIGMTMSMMGCWIAETKARGQWVSDCVHKYIKHPLTHKVMVDMLLSWGLIKKTFELHFLHYLSVCNWGDM